MAEETTIRHCLGNRLTDGDDVIGDLCYRQNKHHGHNGPGMFRRTEKEQ
jgi:hypothetical protein